jgi:DoxX-like family
MTTATSNSKVRNIASNILIFLPSIALLGSSFTKFTHVPGIVAQMTALGFSGPRLMIVAALELASAALFLVPKTRPFGLLLISACLGGAIAAQLGHGEPPAPPAALLALIWIGIWLKKSAITT